MPLETQKGKKGFKKTGIIRTKVIRVSEQEYEEEMIRRALDENDKNGWKFIREQLESKNYDFDKIEEILNGLDEVGTSDHYKSISDIISDVEDYKVGAGICDKCSEECEKLFYYKEVELKECCICSLAENNYTCEKCNGRN